MKINKIIMTTVVPMVVALASSAFASLIYTENFNSYTVSPGNINSTQPGTGFRQAFGGNVPGWTSAGGNAVHAVDLSGGAFAPGDNVGIMLIADNTLLLTTGLAANSASALYQVTFNYGTADYHGTSATTAANSIRFKVLDATSTILSTGLYTPGLWDETSNINFSAGNIGTLQYTGNGNGGVRFMIQSGGGPDGNFYGAIDNLSVNDVPEPSSIALLAGGLGCLACWRRTRCRL